MANLLKAADGDVPIQGLKRLAFGASWTPTAGGTKGLFGAAKRKKGVDLDAVGVLKYQGEPVRYLGWDILDVLNGAVTHSGDNLTGAGEGDDETITVNFEALASAPIDEIVILGTAFKKGSKLNQAADVSFKVYTQGMDEERLELVADIWPSLLMKGNTIGVAKIVLVDGAWVLRVLNLPLTIKQGDFESLLKEAVKL